MNSRLLGLASVICLGGTAQGANPNALLAVAPTAPVIVATILGQNPDPRIISFVITNAGRGTVRWSAGVDEDWLRVSPSTGVLHPHGHAELTVELGDTSLFRAGVFPATVGVTNLSGRQSPELRLIALRVSPPGPMRLPAPALAAEPAFTRGTSNSVAWARVPGANQYRVQASLSPDFANAVSTGWLAATQHTFLDLKDGAAYLYRVQARSNSVAWSQTLPEHFATNENRHVSTRTQPGDVVLEGNTNRIWFEDFEAPGLSWTNTLFRDLSLGEPVSN